MNHPLIIGAGGVASYLLPVLIKTFRPKNLTLIDKDVLEERNLDRQMFDAKAVGEYKADALHQMNLKAWMEFCKPERGHAFTVQLDWFSEGLPIPEDVDAIICVADNHLARHAAIQRAYDLSIRCYLGGNEYFDSQAYVTQEEWRGTPKDPLVRYPAIATDTSGSPLHNCTGEAQVSDPQLAIANQACASKLLHLLWLYERWLPENRDSLNEAAINALPYELFSSLFENSIT